MAERNVRSKELAAFVGITDANLSLLKHGKVKGVRFETLERICEYLDCEPGDILRREPSPPEKVIGASAGRPITKV
jgi:putative transcriptional regulator